MEYFSSFTSKQIPEQHQRASLPEPCSTHDLFSAKVQFEEADITRIFDMLSGKGSRLFNQYSGNRGVMDRFRKRHMDGNVFIRIAVKKLLEDLANERRIGRGLKGMSRLLFSEIEAKLWDLISIQVQLMRQDEEIAKYHEFLLQGPKEPASLN